MDGNTHGEVVTDDDDVASAQPEVEEENRQVNQHRNPVEHKLCEQLCGKAYMTDWPTGLSMQSIHHHTYTGPPRSFPKTPKLGLLVSSTQYNYMQLRC